MRGQAGAAAACGANSATEKKVTSTENAFNAMRRRQRVDVPHLLQEENAKRQRIADLHDEFGCTEAACGVGADDASGRHGARRRDCVASGGIARVEHDSHRDDGRASGGAAVGITATELAKPNTVPSFVTADVSARSCEDVKANSEAVPARRRIVGKRRVIHPPAQPADVGIDDQALVASLRDVREPLPPGRCCGLSGRPPEQ